MVLSQFVLHGFGVALVSCVCGTGSCFDIFIFHKDGFDSCLKFLSCQWSLTQMQGIEDFFVFASSLLSFSYLETFAKQVNKMEANWFEFVSTTL